MLSVVHASSSNRGPAGHTRRELLRIGGLSLLGLGAGELARLRAAAPIVDRAGGERRKHACVARAVVPAD